MSRPAAVLLAALLVAACDSKTPTAPSVAPTAPPASPSPTSAEHVLIIRALDADTKASVSGLDVTILDGPRAGNTSSTPSDQLPVSLPDGHATLRITAAGHMPLEVAVEVNGAALLEVAVQRSPTPTPSPTPSPSPGPTYVTLTGVVRDAATGRGIPNAEVECITAPCTGRGGETNASGVYRIDGLPDSAIKVSVAAQGYVAQSFSIASPREPVNFSLTAIPTWLYAGTVRDGTGRPLPGVRIEAAGGQKVVSDSNGHYEFRDTHDTVQATVWTPDGYEPTPKIGGVNWVGLRPGQDITVRRIVKVWIYPPPTIGVGNWTRVDPRIEFDTGQMESPVWGYFGVGGSDSSMIVGHVENNTAYIEGRKVGTTDVGAGYHGAPSALYTVQVVR